MKRGLSTIVSTLLILLLVFVAVGILWVVVRNVVMQGTEQVSLGKFTLDLAIDQVQLNNETNSFSIKIKRNPGDGEFVGIKVIVFDEDNSEIFTINGSLKEYERKSYEFILELIDVDNIKKIQIAPVFRLESGKEVVGDVKDTWEKSESPLGIVETTTPNENNSNVGLECSVDSNCTGIANSGNYCSGDTIVIDNYNYFCNSENECDYNSTTSVVENCSATGKICDDVTRSCVEATVCETQAEVCITGVCGIQTNNCGEEFNCGSCGEGEDGEFLFDEINLFNYGDIIYVNSESSMQNAINDANPGDAIVLRNGNYNDFQITIESNGNEDNPIIVRAETSGGVVFHGSTSFILSSDSVIIGGFIFEDVAETIFQFNGATNSRVTQNAFFQCGTKQPFAKKVVQFTNEAQYNRLDYNLFKCIIGSTVGIEVRRGTAEPSDINPDTCTLYSGVPSNHIPNIYNYNNTIDHNMFKDIPSTSSIPDGYIYGGSTWNDGETIQLGYGGTGLGLCPTYTVITYNIFDTACGDPEIISSKASHDVIANNVFMRNRPESNQYRDADVAIRGGIKTVLSGNYFFNGVGLSVNGENHTITNNYFTGQHDFATVSFARGLTDEIGGVARHNLIAHNTFTDFNRRAFLIGRDCSSGDYPPTDNTYVNNLFYTNLMETKTIDIYCTGDDVVEGNLLSINNGRYGDWDSGYITSNPQLSTQTVNGYSIYRLSSGSPPVNAGINAGVFEDIFGRERNLPDIGAEEYSSSSILDPVNAQDILTGWMMNYYNQECDVW